MSVISWNDLNYCCLINKVFAKTCFNHYKKLNENNNCFMLLLILI